ncbi:hypothetical protein Tco_0397267 [Tanacetum coccineum]
MKKGSNPVAAQLPIVQRPEIVSVVQANQELDLGAVESNFEIPELVGEVRVDVVAKDATVEVPELVDEVRAHVVAKDATVEKAELVDEVSSDREVDTLKKILRLIDKAGGNVVVVDVVRKRLAAIEKFPEQSVNNDSENVRSIHNVVDAEDGKLFHTNAANFFDCLQVDNGIDLRLPNLNEPFSESAVDENHDFDNYMELDKEGDKACHYSLDTISEFGKGDDNEAEKLQEALLDKEENKAYQLSLDATTEFRKVDDNEAEKAVLENEENKPDEAEKLQELVLDKEENKAYQLSLDDAAEFGKRDDNEAEKVREAMFAKEEKNLDHYSLDEDTSSSRFVDDYEDDKVGESMLDEKVEETVLENEENKPDDYYFDEFISDIGKLSVLDKEQKNADKYSIDAILAKGKEDDRKDDKGDSVLENKENNVDKYSIAAISVQGKEDDCVEENVGEAVFDKEENSVEMDEVPFLQTSPNMFPPWKGISFFKVFNQLHECIINFLNQ